MVCSIPGGGRIGTIAAAMLALAAAGCAASPHDVSVAPPMALRGTALGAATLTITVPARSLQYVSTATKSLSAALVSVNGAAPTPAVPATVVSLTASSPNCTSSGGSLSCSATITAPAGSDVFAVSTFASTDGTGPALSTATTPATTISANGRNTVALALSGVVAGVRIALSPVTVPAGTPATIAVSVAALDASGATIVGNTAYDRPITLTNSDTSGAFTLSATSVTSPSTTVTLRYSGGAVSAPVTIGASATGIATASIAPAAVSAGGTLGAPVSVYDLGVDTTFAPSPAGNDARAFNLKVPGYGATPPPSRLVGSGSLYGGNAGALYDLTLAANLFNGTKYSNACGCVVATTSTNAATREFEAVQTWPFYVGSGTSSNLRTGTYVAQTRSDDASWLVLGTSPLTFAQSATVNSASGLSANVAFVNNPNIAPPTAATGSVTIAAAATGATTPDANLYWITMQYVELSGGGAELDYSWKPPGATSLGQVTQAVIYGQVTQNGAPLAGQTVVVGDPAGGTHSLVTDANGFYGYNYPPFPGPQNVTVTAASVSATVALSPGQAVRQDLAVPPA